MTDTLTTTDLTVRPDGDRLSLSVEVEGNLVEILLTAEQAVELAIGLVRHAKEAV